MIDVYVAYEGHEAKLARVKPDQVEPLVESVKKYGVYLDPYTPEELEFSHANYDEGRGGFLIWFDTV